MPKNGNWRLSNKKSKISKNSELRWKFKTESTFLIVTQWRMDDCCAHILTILYIMSVLITHRCKYNEIWCDCHTSERFSAIKPGLIHHFLHLKMPVPSQEYCSCCSFVWCVLSFDFAIWLWTFRFDFSSEFSIFVF